MSSGSAGSGQVASRQDASSAGVSGAPSDVFNPTGLRVLVVDDDSMCLKVVSAMLQRCSYEVTTCNSGSEALTLLRARHDDGADQFDLVLSDVYMPDMDGFKLLEHIGLELDLPVIMMSSNGDTNVVLRGVTHGAVDFLIKPVRIEELRNVWQHVVRRRSMALVRAPEEGGHDDDDDSQRHGIKRKESETSPLQLSTEQAGSKKPRVVWSVEMHQQFVNAVNTLGIDKAVPKRILDLMNVEGLTRENVASHLQKYRLYLKRVEGVQSGNGKQQQKGGRGAEAAAAPAAAAYGGLTQQQQAAQQLQQEQRKQQQQQQQLNGVAMQSMQGLPPGLMGMGPQSPAPLPFQQAFAMQAAAAAAAASGALPGSMPPFMPPPAMMAPGMPGMRGMMGQPQVMPGMDMGPLAYGNGMMFAQPPHPAAASMPPPLGAMGPGAAGPPMPPVSMGQVGPCMGPLGPGPAGDALHGGVAPPVSAAAALGAQQSLQGMGSMGPAVAGVARQGSGLSGHASGSLLGGATPDVPEQRLLAPPTQEAHQLTLGGFGQEDPLSHNLGNLNDMAFLSDLGSGGVKAEADDFLDLFLKESMNEEL